MDITASRVNHFRRLAASGKLVTYRIDIFLKKELMTKDQVGREGSKVIRGHSKSDDNETDSRLLTFCEDCASFVIVLREVVYLLLR